MLISKASPSTTNRQERFIALHTLLEYVAGFGLLDYGAGREGDDQVLAAPSRLIFPSTVLPPLSLEMFFEVEVIKGVHSGCGSEKYVTALAAVATVWTPFGNVFFASKTHAAIAAISRLDGNKSFVKKLHLSRIADGIPFLLALFTRDRSRT